MHLRSFLRLPYDGLTIFKGRWKNVQFNSIQFNSIQFNSGKKFKFSILAVCMLFAFTLVACGNSSDDEEDTLPAPPDGFVIVPETTGISSFYMCEHEVTRAEFKTIMGQEPSGMVQAIGDTNNNNSMDNVPVSAVNWYDAITYCNKRSIEDGLTPCYSIPGTTNNWKELTYDEIPTEKSDKWNAITCDTSANGYRLPTEAEWKWACKGGQSYKYAGSDTLSDVAWYYTNSQTAAHLVMLLKANGYGLYDMYGNVREWCFTSEDKTIDDVTYPGRVVCGGSCIESEEDFNNARLVIGKIYERNEYIGFRVVRSK